MKTGKGNKGSKKIIGTWIAVMLIFIAELLFYTWCRVQCVKTGYQITHESEKYQDLTTLGSNLKIELARLKSPKRIDRIARTMLGLTTPETRQIINIQ